MLSSTRRRSSRPASTCGANGIRGDLLPPVLPLTYPPILLVGNDRSVTGRYVNGPVSRVLGGGYFVLICVLAVAAPILFVATNGGS